MSNKPVNGVKSAFAFSVKLAIMASVLVSQSFSTEALLSQNYSGSIPAAQAASASTVTTYVVPAIGSNILPKVAVSSSYKSDTISTQMSGGEYTPVSFVVNSSSEIGNLKVEASDLKGEKGTIPSANVDIKTVKCWYQGSYGYYSLTNGRYLIPELLLKDDSLVKVDGDDWSKLTSSNSNGKNYLKLTNGSYVDISSDEKNSSDLDIIPISERPVKDASTLQPVNLPANYNKQFWVTLYVPAGTSAGAYSGTINLKNGSEAVKSLSLKVQVLPIVLPEPNVKYSIYYTGMIKGSGSISSYNKTEEQYKAEQEDMVRHGVTNSTVKSATDDSLVQQLSIRRQAGMDNTDLYYYGSTMKTSDISRYKEMTAPYGVKNLYLYGPDENPVDRSQIKEEHDAGAKHLNSANVYANADSAADILDQVNAMDFWPDLADKYHGYGHKIFLYGKPYSVIERPNLHRIDYGLALWQNNYDGAMDFAYQRSLGDIWNDFDHNERKRDYAFAYPTMDGVIDTLQWEGFREGVNDMRYLAALQKAISAKGSEDSTSKEAQKYLKNLKSSDLTSKNLYTVRSQMIKYILALESSTTQKYALTVKNGTGSGSYAENAQVTITADSAPAGKVFDKWTGDTKYISSTASATATVTIPNKAVSVVAVYKAASAQKYALTITNGTGSGSYTEGTKVTITANAASSGKVFDKWTGDTKYLSSTAAASATVTMPNKAASLVAAYKDVSVQKYALTIINGTGSGSYAQGDKVTIAANPAISEKVFDKWTGDTKYLSSTTAATATVTMPAKAIKLTANYKTVPSTQKYPLTVKNGSGSGSYAQGDKITITADAAPAGKIFSKWTGDTRYLSRTTAASVTVTMPNKAVNVAANYSVIPVTQSLKSVITSTDTKVKKGATGVTLVEAALTNTGTETLSVSGLGIMADFGASSVNNVKLYIDNADMGSPAKIKAYEVIYSSLPLKIEAGKTVKLTLKGDISANIKLKNLGFRLDSCTNVFTVKGTTTGKKAKLSIGGKSYLYFVSK